MVVMAAVYLQWYSVSMGETARPYTEEAFAREAGVPAVSSDATRGGPPEQSNPFGPLKVDSPPDTPLNSGSQEPHYFPPTLYPTLGNSQTSLGNSQSLVEAATVSSQGGQLTEAEMRALLAEAGWPAELIPQALAVSWCESKWSPGAIGDSGRSVGLFQVNAATWFPYAGEDASQWADPLVNARVAWRTYQYDIGRGYESWRQWSCKP